MLGSAFPHIASLFGDPAWSKEARRFGDEILRGAREAFWDEERGLFVVNRPWLVNGESPRLCDRSLATAILFDQCPGGRTGPALDALADPPAGMGLSYPANAGWRLWALAHGRRIEPVLKDLRTRWRGIPSVAATNTLAEYWSPLPDSGDLWSHCPVAPLYIMGMGIAGIRPVDPGWKRILFAPLAGDLTSLDATVHTPCGPAELHARGGPGGRMITIRTPDSAEGILAVDHRETGFALEEIPPPVPGTRAFRLPAGTENTVPLRFT
jgi:hypothetical protein